MSKRKPKAAARELAAIVAEIHEAFRNDTASVIRRGSLLIEAKAQLKHGRWLPWLDENFDMDERTAQRAMSAAKFAAKYDSAVVFNLSVEALYALGGEVHKNGLHWEHYARGYLRYAPPVVTAAIEEAKTKLVSLKRLNAIASELTSDPAPQTIEEMEAEIEAEAAEEEQRAAQGQAEADAILDGSPPELPPIEMPKRELPAKVKVNGQPTNTADFSPAAQAQIVAALADKQAEHVIANLPGSWDLQPSDDADASAAKRKAHYAASESESPDAFDVEIRHVSVLRNRVIPTTPERISKMKEALARDGLLSPILIRLADHNSYRVVAGATRFEAAKSLGWDKIKAVLFHGTPNEISLAEITENKNRNDLTDLELRHLRDEEIRLLAEIKKADKHKKEHFQSALLIHADQAGDLAGMFYASYQKCPAAITTDAIEAANRTAVAWSKIAQLLGRGAAATSDAEAA